MQISDWFRFVKVPRPPSRLSLLNRYRSSGITGVDGPVVSMTTHGPRIHSVHLAIESISLGEVLPSRIILWLEDEELLHHLPSALHRLRRRGLEIRITKGYGPHTKYFPYVDSEDSFPVPLVTADDDVLYPRFWLKGLVEAFQENPQVVNCYRARVVGFNGEAIEEYAKWKFCESVESSYLHFATGVSGVIYPPQFLAALKQTGTSFTLHSLKNDDIWLHVQALRAGYKVRQVGPQAVHFPMIAGTQDSALFQNNVLHGGNDSQIKATYEPSDLELLRQHGHCLSD